MIAPVSNLPLIGYSGNCAGSAGAVYVQVDPISKVSWLRRSHGTLEKRAWRQGGVKLRDKARVAVV